MILLHSPVASEKEPNLREISDYERDLSPKKRRQIFFWMALGVGLSLLIVGIVKIVM